MGKIPGFWPHLPRIWGVWGVKIDHFWPFFSRIFRKNRGPDPQKWGIFRGVKKWFFSIPKTHFWPLFIEKKWKIFAIQPFPQGGLRLTPFPKNFCCKLHPHLRKSWFFCEKNALFLQIFSRKNPLFSGFFRVLTRGPPHPPRQTAPFWWGAYFSGKFWVIHRYTSVHAKKCTLVHVS